MVSSVVSARVADFTVQREIVTPSRMSVFNEVSLHTLTVLSAEPLTMREPNGSKATEVTDAECPVPVAMAPKAKSSVLQTLTVPSWEPLTIRPPSALNATEVTPNVLCCAAVAVVI